MRLQPSDVAEPQSGVAADQKGVAHLGLRERQFQIIKQLQFIFIQVDGFDRFLKNLEFAALEIGVERIVVVERIAQERADILHELADYIRTIAAPAVGCLVQIFDEIVVEIQRQRFQRQPDMPSFGITAQSTFWSIGSCGSCRVSGVCPVPLRMVPSRQALM